MCDLNTHYNLSGNLVLYLPGLTKKKAKSSVMYESHHPKAALSPTCPPQERSFAVA
jgi:hypothetical protein